MGKKKKIPGKFVAVLNDQIDSDAFKSLSGKATKAYLLIHRQRFMRNTNGHVKNVKENEIKIGHSDIKEWMSRNSWYRSVKELEEAGFITILQEGGLRHKTSIYALSTDWKIPKEMR